MKLKKEDSSIAGRSRRKKRIHRLQMELKKEDSSAAGKSRRKKTIYCFQGRRGFIDRRRFTGFRGEEDSSAAEEVEKKKMFQGRKWLLYFKGNGLQRKEDLLTAGKVE
jgi:hypothetical protein